MFIDLSKYSVVKSKGRKHPELFDDDRNVFLRDKHRVIHSKAFRRLDKKTQVFMAGTGDHYRTRLTHSLEVAQVARDIARNMNLNEDLCEVIALAHDLGHPPFGHSGEDALDEILNKHDLQFEHNEQSLRVVEKIEKSYPKFDGLNLSIEVLEGLIKHQTAFDQSGKIFEFSASLEAQVVNIADEIAYTSHDIDDGLRSGLINIKQMDKITLWQDAKKIAKKEFGDIKEENILISRTISKLLRIMIKDLLNNTKKNINSTINITHFEGNIIDFSENMKTKLFQLRDFLLNNFYLNPKILIITDKGKNMIKKLFDFYLKNPDKLPRDDKSIISIKDYIAGMTDNFLIKEYSKI
jgi:dGTPase